MVENKKTPTAPIKVKKQLPSEDIEHLPDLKIGTPISVGMPSRSGISYVRAWLVAKVPTDENKSPVYTVSFGKNAGRKRADVPLCLMHAACLAPVK